MNVLDLFSGIGGFALGLERAGMHVVAFCECERYARTVLAKHWPLVPCYEDVRTLTATRLASDGIGPVDLICGGFPCQDVSLAGSGAGLAGARSGLWREFRRLIGEIRPRFVIVENTAALLSRGLGEVLGDLAALGFDAEWHCLPACAIGAPHIRDRVWVVAYADGEPLRHDEQRQARRRHDVSNSGHAELAHDGLAQSLADTDGGRWEGERLAQHIEQQSTSGDQSYGRGARGSRPRSTFIDAAFWEREREAAREWWRTEPDVGRVAYGLSSRVDRVRAAKQLQCLGNAVLPQFPEIIGRAIMQAEQRTRAK